MLPKWLLPSITELPEVTVKGTTRHAPMVDAKAYAITKYNERVREEKRNGVGAEQRRESARRAGLARWKHLPKL